MVTASPLLMTLNYLRVSYKHKSLPTRYDYKLARRLLNVAGLSGANGYNFLDLGAGTGTFRKPFEVLGARYVGIDIDSHDSSHEILNYDISRGSLPVLSDSVDVIFLKMVIEHIPFEKIRVLLDEARRCLVNGGKIIIITPDWSLNYREFYDEFTHVSPFTQSSLACALEIADFEITYSKNLVQLPFLWNNGLLEWIISRFFSLFYVGPLKKIKLVKYSHERPLLFVAQKVDRPA